MTPEERKAFESADIRCRFHFYDARLQVDTTQTDGIVDVACLACGQANQDAAQAIHENADMRKAFEAMREALVWYAENAQNILYHGENYRHLTLGQRARAALALADKVRSAALTISPPL